MDPEIAVVVPTYRRPDVVRRLLGALAAQTLDPSRWELVLVDNASHDPRVDAVAEDLPALVPCRAGVARIETNRGPAAARNLGWRTTRAPFVAFLDDDVLPEPRWLEAGLTAMEDPAVGVVQGRTCPPDDEDPRTRSFPAWWWWHIIEEPTPFFEACNIFYRRDALASTGGFDEQLQWWGEDTAAGWRVVDGGWKRGFAPDAVVVHPVEYRGAAWHIRNGWRERNNIALAARHPGFRRDAFWRPWAYRRRDAAFVLAAVSVVAAFRWRAAALGVVPYLRISRPAPQHKRRGVWMQAVAVDAARTAGHLAGAIRHRVLVV